MLFRGTAPKPVLRHRQKIHIRQLSLYRQCRLLAAVLLDCRNNLYPALPDVLYHMGAVQCVLPASADFHAVALCKAFVDSCTADLYVYLSFAVLLRLRQVGLLPACRLHGHSILYLSKAAVRCVVIFLVRENQYISPHRNQLLFAVRNLSDLLPAIKYRRPVHPEQLFSCH